ncbi:MAG: hypothetical protein ABSE43_18140 [Steroidobacteraceae bacterium]|jgi:hypothetical protein
MQDALGDWPQESHLSPQMLRSLRGLNHRFLDLAAARPEWAALRVSQLSSAQREAAAACPYALFDLRFQEESYWQQRLQIFDSWRVADAAIADETVAGEARVDEATASFARLALFYAWHVASNASLTAQLLLGMSGPTVVAFRRITVNRLPSLVPREAAHLSVRWSGCTAYWSALVAAASRTDSAALKRVQLYGLQLAAAARLGEP